jgi:hypothetical protein
MWSAVASQAHSKEMNGEIRVFIYLKSFHRDLYPV